MDIEQQFEQARLQTEALENDKDDLESSLAIVDATDKTRFIAQPRTLNESEKKAVDAFYEAAIIGKNTGVRTDAVIVPRPANEGLADIIDSIGSSVTKSMAKTAIAVLTSASASLNTYHDLSKSLHKRLLVMRAMLASNQDAVSKKSKFVATTNKRFFQFNGKNVDTFSEFAAGVRAQYDIAKYDLGKGVSYSTLLSEKVIADLEKLATTPDALSSDKFRNSIAYHWRDVWRDGFKTDYMGTVPKIALTDIVESRVFPVSALFDARQLVATEPLKPREAKNITKYMAKVVFDRKTPLKPSGEFVMPSAVELLPVIDMMLDVLRSMFVYKDLVDVYKKTSRIYKDTTSKLLDKLGNRASAKDIASVNEYIALGTGCVNMIVNPHTELAWMNIRTALAVASVVEHYLFDAKDPAQITRMFFAPVKEPVAAALEARQETYSLVLAMLSSLNKS